MNTYQVDYQWDDDQAVPVLNIMITGDLPDPARILPAVINRTHAYVDQYDSCGDVYLVYDLTGTSGKLPLAALMQRGTPSPKVKRVAIIGADSRSDEMAVLIMASARHIPYEYGFFSTLSEAATFIYAPHTTQRIS